MQLSRAGFVPRRADGIYGDVCEPSLGSRRSLGDARPDAASKIRRGPWRTCYAVGAPRFSPHQLPTTRDGLFGVNPGSPTM